MGNLDIYESETESAHAHFLALESAQKVRNVFWQARGAKKRENSSYSPGSVMSQEKTKSLFFSFWLVSFHTFNMGKLSCI